MQSYKTWIARWLDVNGPLGDISRLIYMSSNFPDSSDKDTIRCWLVEQGMCENTRMAFIGTWKWYLADVKRKPKEVSLEQVLVFEVEKRGGLCWKFTSPGTVGVPDRIVIVPGGRVAFVEMKSPTGKLQPIQRKRATELTDRCAEWYLLKSNQDILVFLEEMFGDEVHPA